ncbi:hypothetical protein HKBW3S47_01118 [Candidatus Hakubella thermalkaliphila]|nr:hypothetical protein HKBW3S47_01118 [Candidatus Hakubella thermalkaliphila]
MNELKKIGYRLQLKGDHIICTWGGNGQPDPQKVEPLLAEVSIHKEEAIHYLREERAREQDLFLRSFKQALIQLNRRYQPGTLDWTQSHCPVLYQKIEH